MPKITKSKISRHKIGGQTHIPEAVWNIYELKPGDEFIWWKPSPYEKFDECDEDLIIIKIVRKKSIKQSL